MRYLLFLFLVLPIMGTSQVILSTDTLSAPKELVNVQATKIAGDSLVSSFLIYIKETVPMHKHAHHSENVVVLEGTATMQVGSLTTDIKPGDVIFIPANTFHEVKVTSDVPLKVISIQAPEFDGTDRIPYVKN